MLVLNTGPGADRLALGPSGAPSWLWDLNTCVTSVPSSVK